MTRSSHWQLVYAQLVLMRCFILKFPSTTWIVWSLSTTMFMVKNVGHTTNEETNAKNIMNII